MAGLVLIWKRTWTLYRQYLAERCLSLAFWIVPKDTTEGLLLVQWIHVYCTTSLQAEHLMKAEAVVAKNGKPPDYAERRTHGD